MSTNWDDSSRTNEQSESRCSLSTQSRCHFKFPKVVLAHILGEVGSFCKVLSNVSLRTCLPFVYEIGSYLTNQHRVQTVLTRFEALCILACSWLVKFITWSPSDSIRSDQQSWRRGRRRMRWWWWWGRDTEEGFVCWRFKTFVSSWRSRANWRRIYGGPRIRYVIYRC